MDYKGIKEQLALAEKSAREIKNQSRIFENTLQEAVKGAPIEAKSQIDQIRVLSAKAISLAKQGKMEESQQLIKDFQNGRKNS